MLREQDVIDFLFDFPGWQTGRRISEALAADLGEVSRFCDTLTREGKLDKNHQKASYKIRGE